MKVRPQAEVDAEVKIVLAAERRAERRERIATAVFAAMHTQGSGQVSARYAAEESVERAEVLMSVLDAWDEFLNTPWPEIKSDDPPEAP